jgi:hypothetical protein
MDGLGAVSGVGLDQADKAASISGVTGDAAREAMALQSIQMVPPGAEGSPAGVSFGDKIWSNLGSISVQMREVQDSIKTSLAEPVKPSESTGDMVLDMRNTMVEMQGQQTQLLAMQIKMSESSNVFSVGLGMIQSAQHSARTLLQDK